MSRRVVFSANYPDMEDIGEHYELSVKSMNLLYSPVNPEFVADFQYYSHEEVEEEKETRLEEIDASLALTLLASIEASFRVDYLRRCYQRKKDPLSRVFRTLYKRKGRKVSFEEELLEGWKNHSNVSPRLLGEIKGAFNYRHWLAHGRYWMPRLGRQYDFSSIFDLAYDVSELFPFERV